MPAGIGATREIHVVRWLVVAQGAVAMSAEAMRQIMLLRKALQEILDAYPSAYSLATLLRPGCRRSLMPQPARRRRAFWGTADARFNRAERRLCPGHRRNRAPRRPSATGCLERTGGERLKRPFGTASPWQPLISVGGRSRRRQTAGSHGRGRGRIGPALVLALHGGSGPARRLPRREVQLIRTKHRPTACESDPVGNALAANAATVADRGTIRH